MKEFESKKGYEILIPTLALLIGAIVFPIINEQPLNVIIIVMIIIIPVGLLMLSISFGTSYKINENSELQIKCGFLFNSVVDISKIRSISKSNSILASPAPSLDRIEIKHGKWDSVIISPSDKKGLIQELTKINPDISTDADLF